MSLVIDMKGEPMRPIDADVLKEVFQNEYKVSFAEAINEVIDEQPTVQPERKKGMFIGTEFDGYADGNPAYYEWICSECGCTFEDDEPTYNFCPNCGCEIER